MSAASTQQAQNRICSQTRVGRFRCDSAADIASPREMAETIIHCWSGPRCCSTALMYSWAQRHDTKVLDEPLYGAYLHRTGIDHPSRDEILAAGGTDGDAVLASQIYACQTNRPILYCKQIAKHKMGCKNSIFDRDTHCLLVREPAGVIRSWNKVAEPSMQELGYTALLEIISELRIRGRRVIVVLSDELVREPEATLRTMCTALGVEFMPSMLSWPPGPKPYDGVWAKYWYDGTHKSTGFAGGFRESSNEALPPQLHQLYQECSALYSAIAPLAIRATSNQVLRSPAQQLAHEFSQSMGRSSAPDLAATAQGPSEGPGQNGSLAMQDSTGAPGCLSIPAARQSSLPRPASVGVPSRTSTPQADASGRAVAPEQPAALQKGTHAYVQDPRNADVLIGIRDGVTNSFDLVWRPHAKVSVLDSGYMLGDGVWEGIRLHKGVLIKVDAHLERLWEGAKALDMTLDLTQQQLQELLYRTVDANNMSSASGVHIRLMVTRGLKPTPYQSPYITIGKPTIVIIPEYKEPLGGPSPAPISLFTCHVRRGAPDVQDPGWNSHSKLNCIAACIQAKKAGADEALMLDPHGFVATCNSVNFFIVRKGVVWAPTTKYLMQGITRAAVLSLCAQHGIPCRELDFSLTQVYSADEAFVTGTFAGLTPVHQVDGRLIAQAPGPITARLQKLYIAAQDQQAEAGRKTLLN